MSAGKFSLEYDKKKLFEKRSSRNFPNAVPPNKQSIDIADPTHHFDSRSLKSQTQHTPEMYGDEGTDIETLPKNIFTKESNFGGTTGGNRNNREPSKAKGEELPIRISAKDVDPRTSSLHNPTVPYDIKLVDSPTSPTRRGSGPSIENVPEITESEESRYPKKSDSRSPIVTRGRGKSNAEKVATIPPNYKESDSLKMLQCNWICVFIHSLV
jgi:hypothetical protein